MINNNEPKPRFVPLHSPQQFAEIPHNERRNSSLSKSSIRSRVVYVATTFGRLWSGGIAEADEVHILTRRATGGYGLRITTYNIHLSTLHVLEGIPS